MGALCYNFAVQRMLQEPEPRAIGWAPLFYIGYPGRHASPTAGRSEVNGEQPAPAREKVNPNEPRTEHSRELTQAARTMPTEKLLGNPKLPVQALPWPQRASGFPLDRANAGHLLQVTALNEYKSARWLTADEVEAAGGQIQEDMAPTQILTKGRHDNVLARDGFGDVKRNKFGRPEYIKANVTESSTWRTTDLYNLDQTTVTDQTEGARSPVPVEKLQELITARIEGGLVPTGNKDDGMHRVRQTGVVLKDHESWAAGPGRLAVPENPTRGDLLHVAAVAVDKLQDTSRDRSIMSRPLATVRVSMLANMMGSLLDGHSAGPFALETDQDVTQWQTHAEYEPRPYWMYMDVFDALCCFLGDESRGFDNDGGFRQSMGRTDSIFYDMDGIGVAATPGGLADFDPSLGDVPF